MLFAGQYFSSCKHFGRKSRRLFRTDRCDDHLIFVKRADIGHPVTADEFLKAVCCFSQGFAADLIIGMLCRKASDGLLRIQDAPMCTVVAKEINDAAVDRKCSFTVG